MVTNEGITSAQAKVLAVLRDAAAGLTLGELHEATGLHENTLRGHLDALVSQQSVSRIAVRTGGRGRPAWRYVARQSEYSALAMALAAGMDSGDSHALDPDARNGGRAWGERLRTQLAPSGSGHDRVLLALQHTGFEPQTDGDDTISLHACPLLDAARAHPGVVCAVHLGLVEGVLGREGARLEPRPETLGCKVTLT